MKLSLKGVVEGVGELKELLYWGLSGIKVGLGGGEVEVVGGVGLKLGGDGGAGVGVVGEEGEGEKIGGDCVGRAIVLDIAVGNVGVARGGECGGSGGRRGGGKRGVVKEYQYSPLHHHNLYPR